MEDEEVPNVTVRLSYTFMCFEFHYLRKGAKYEITLGTFLCKQTNCSQNSQKVYIYEKLL